MKASRMLEVIMCNQLKVGEAKLEALELLQIHKNLQEDVSVLFALVQHGISIILLPAKEGEQERYSVRKSGKEVSWSWTREVAVSKALEAIRR